MSKPVHPVLPSGIIKALSFKQPIAWLIANGYLAVDDRSWGTSYREPVLIHASKSWYQAYYEHIKRHTDIPIPEQDQLGFGGVVGLARLVLCSKPGALPANLGREQRAYFNGVAQDDFVFLFTQATPLPLMPCPGKLGMFEIEMDQLRATPPSAQATLF